MKKISFVAAILAGLLAMGCEDKKGGDSAGTAGGAGEEVQLVVEKMNNIKLMAPKGSKAEDVMGDPAVKFPDGSMITLGEPGPIQEETLEGAIKDAKETYAGGKDFAQETLPNGWIYKFVNEAPVGKMFMVVARIKVGDKFVMCNAANANNAEQQMTAYKACKSIKP